MRLRMANDFIVVPKNIFCEREAFFALAVFRNEVSYESPRAEHRRS
jgi:hypothetical protein